MVTVEEAGVCLARKAGFVFGRWLLLIGLRVERIQVRNADGAPVKLRDAVISEFLNRARDGFWASRQQSGYVLPSHRQL